MIAGPIEPRKRARGVRAIAYMAVESMERCNMKHKSTGCGIRSLSGFEKTRILEALSKSTLAKPRRTKQNRRSLDTSGVRLAFYETIRFKPGGVLMRSIVFLGMTLLAASVGIGQNHPSLPSS